MPCHTCVFGSEGYCSCGAKGTPNTDEYGNARNSTPAEKDLGGMLCEALKLLEEWKPEDTDLRQVLEERDPRLVKFLDVHEHIEVEKTRKEALAKLTPRERRALGFK